MSQGSTSLAIIEASINIRAPQNKVWDIISDLDNEPEFWRGTKAVRNIPDDTHKTDLIKREITIAFRDQKCLQEVRIQPKTRIDARFTDGIIRGTKTMTLSSDKEITTLKVCWDITLSGAVMSMFTGIIKKHIKSGTHQAIESIRDKAEH